MSYLLLSPVSSMSKSSFVKVACCCSSFTLQRYGKFSYQPNVLVRLLLLLSYIAENEIEKILRVSNFLAFETATDCHWCISGGAFRGVSRARTHIYRGARVVFQPLRL